MKSDAEEEVTSDAPSGVPSGPREEEHEEVTSEEAPEEPPAKRTRGRGSTSAARAAGRGRARGRLTPAPSRRRRTGRKQRSTIEALVAPPVPQLEGDEATSESEETARIRRAAVAWRAGGVAVAEESIPTARSVDPATPTPLTSGLFDFTCWVVNQVLTPRERGAMEQLQFSYLDLCAGMGTSILAVEALRRALHHNFEGTCIALTESDRKKRLGLVRRLEALAKITAHKDMPKIFSDTADLSKTPPVDADGHPCNLPVADILCMGIVCKDISSLTRTPKSVQDPAGKSGTSWHALLTYLQCCRWEELPRAIILECVARLDHARALDPTEKGTEHVSTELAELGYVGQWSKVSSTSFFLPHRRDRVWAIFLKVGGFGPAAMERQRGILLRALEVAKRCTTTTMEPLAKVLSRCPPDQLVEKKVVNRRPAARRTDAPPRWHTTHEQFLAQHGITPRHLEEGRADFVKAMESLSLTEEQLEGMWLRLVLLRIQGHVLDWRGELLVLTCGASVNWMKVARGYCPCLQPTMKYVILNEGRASIASGRQFLALQGIQEQEALAFGLDQEAPALQRDLAGNAFTANVCCAYLVACLLVL